MLGHPTITVLLPVIVGSGRAVSRTTLSKWEAARSGVRLERLSVVLQPHAVNQGAKRTGSGGGRQGSVLDRMAGSRGSHPASRAARKTRSERASPFRLAPLTKKSRS